MIKEKYIADMNRIKQSFYVMGFTFLLFGVILLIWSIFAPLETLAEKYNEYLVWMSELELKIAAISNKGLVILVIGMLFFVKCALPLYPFSLLFAVSGLVFSFPVAMLINCIGMIFIMTVKYETGVHLGGGNLKRLIKLSDTSYNIVRGDGKGNPWVLFLMRLTPFMPYNGVSQLYGSFEFDIKKFMVISLVGYLPKILTCSIVGRNAKNPFSLGFIMPITVLMFISGISLLILSATLNIINKNSERRK